jgi:hypothetical protein
MPTVLELVGAEMKGLDGESMLPALRGKALKNPVRFIEKMTGTAQSYAAFDIDHKLVIKRSKKRGEFRELYSVASDPMEERNLIHSSAVPSNLEKALENFVKRADAYKIPFQVDQIQVGDRGYYIDQQNGTELSPEEEEKLRALGYVD